MTWAHFRHIRPYQYPGLPGRRQGRSEGGTRVAVEDGVTSLLIGGGTPERSLGHCEIGFSLLSESRC
jgi:hypothetical protein